MTTPRISILVPFYNNADVLDDCLASIAAQTHRALEVIMVDDGSTDEGAAIAGNWAATDHRFRLIQIPNGSPGLARNRGVEHASGEYLAFVDGDDMLPPHAYEMLHTLESSGSDFVSGAVNRFGTGGVHPSSLHERAIKGRKTATHVTRSPELLYDISVWNKLFRRSFWDAHRLHYPEGMVWEDLQLMTRAHVLATAVDVIPDRIYHWRERAAGAFSITQNRTSIQNLRDRITALLAIDGFLRGHAPARLLRQHQRKALVNDLWLYVRDLGRVDEGYLREYFELVGGYLATVSRRTLRCLPATHKLAYHLTGRRLERPLLQFVTWLLDQPVTTIPVVRRHGRLRAGLPLRTDRALGIPGWVYRPHWRDLDPFVAVEGVGWQRGSLVISGLAYVPSVSIGKRRNTSKIVILRPRRRFRPPVVAVATSYRHPRATVLSGQENYDYTWAGFRCEISSRWFRLAGRWLTGDWDCFVLVRAHGVWRPARLHSPALGDAGRPGALEPAPGLQVRPTWVGRHLHVGVVRTPARLVSTEPGEDGLVLTVRLDPGGRGRAGRPGVAGPLAPEGAEFVLVRQGGIETRVFGAAVGAAGPGAVLMRGTIPLTALRAGRAAGRPVQTARTGAGVVEPAGTGAGVVQPASTGAGLAQPPHTGAGPVQMDPPGGDTCWDLYLQPAGQGRIRVTFPAQAHEAWYQCGDREVAAERSRYGNVTLPERAPRPVITGHGWTHDGTLLLRGRYRGPAGDRLEIILRCADASMDHFLGCDRDGDRFAARADVAAMPAFGRPLPLSDGPWELSARVTGDDGSRAVPMGYDHARLAEISHRKIAAGPKLYAFTTAGYDTPVITAEPQLRLSEQGNFNRRVLRKAFYPLAARRPLRDAVLFVSWKGKQCTDNPRGIAG